MIQNAEYYERLSEHKSLVLHEFIEDNFFKVRETIDDRDVIHHYANANTPGGVVVRIVFKDRENAIVTMLKTRRGRDVWFLTELDEGENIAKGVI